MILSDIAYNEFANGEITLTEYIKYQNRDKIMEKIEAMKILKDFHDKSALFSVRTALDTIIPELKEPKESEDERMRKNLYKCLRYYVPEDIAEEYIAWLEKQGEPNPYSGVSFQYNGHTWGMCTRDNGVEILVDGEIKERVFIKEEKVDNNTNKIEPKFHKGAWVVSEVTGSVYQIKDCIENVTNHKYGYNLTNGKYIGSCDVNHYHLWTINDAKNGDVLATDKSVFIYAKVLYNKPYAYCGVDKFGVFKDNCLENDWSNSVDNIHPATEEQRDLLFQTIKETGYTWDAEKKEVKLLITNGGDFFESKNCEQNSAWNEEDETRIKQLLGWLDTLKNYIHYDALVSLELRRERIDKVSKLESWLKSFKKRLGQGLNPNDVIAWLKPYECVVDHLVEEFKKVFKL